MNESPTLQASNVELLSSHVEERIVGPCRVVMLKTLVQAVVSWRGSFLAYPNVADGDRLVPKPFEPEAAKVGPPTIIR